LRGPLRINGAFCSIDGLANCLEDIKLITKPTRRSQFALLEPEPPL
jgi:hypothetical protein